jgi:hypothetical protein
VDVERLITALVSGALTGRRKPSKKASRFLTGGAPFGRAGHMLTLAGLAWGLIEAATRNTTGAQTGAPAGPTWPPDVRRAAGHAAPGHVVPPPLPTSAPAPTPPPPPLVPPPLPGAAQAAGPGVHGGPDSGVPAGRGSSSGAAAPTEAAQMEGVLRVVRLTIAAAGADGTLTDAERHGILAQARAIDLESQVESELEAPTPLEAIVSGLEGSEQAPDLYTLAFTIVRADAQVTDQERRWLDRLAALLRLDAAIVERLEQDAASRIDRETV